LTSFVVRCYLGLQFKQTGSSVICHTIDKYYRSHTIIIYSYIYMIKNHLVKETVYISLLMQIITTLISLDGLNYDLLKQDEILYEILVLEALVQFVEAGFYIWVILALKDLKMMTPRRYVDWFITTPTMLVSTIIFMEYLKRKETNQGGFTLREFLVENTDDVILIASLNLMMLLCGYLGETGVINNSSAVAIGSVFFAGSFKYIYDVYAQHTQYGKNLFYVIAIVWSLYAVAACMPIVPKNTMYNILDIFSKNFYGIFIYYYIRQIGTRKPS
jgi:hypothetical protein